jgi:membrane fusion protein (multidrug efflux system)
MLARLVLMLAVVGAIGGGLYLLRAERLRDAQAMSERVMPPAAVRVASVQQETWRRTLFAVGSLAPEQGVEVTAPLPGTVVGIEFESGQTVRRGQVLVTMDTGIQTAELEGLLATLELRELQFARARRLREAKQISEAELDTARAARDEAQAAVEAKRAVIARKQVYAPFDGVLGIRRIDLGDYLEPGDPVVPLQMLDPIHVDYALPEQQLSRLTLGQPVEIAVPAWPGETFHGRITAFDPGIDPATRAVRIRATLPNPDQRLRPGMFAQVWTIDPEDKEVLSLPGTAVSYSPYGDSVFVVVGEPERTTVERRQVETGEVREGRVEIRSGVAAGERVVAVGHNKLQNGMRVEVTENATAAIAPEVP